MTSSAAARLPGGLYSLCDDTVRPDLGFATQAEMLLAGGARVLQVRAKRTPLPLWVEQTRRVVQACRRAGALCLVNDRADVALVAGADGVHLGADDLPPSDARALLGPKAMLGVTVRNAEQARTAHAAGADYVGVGPAYLTSTKSVLAPVLGTAGLAAIVRESPLPIVAIGGIGLANIADVARTGARCAAVASDLLTAEDVPARARALQQAFEAAVRR